ncbi:MAG TPA: hypothetical protein VGO11_19455 [Chthoniobacteraceae bacterium]|jgi:hypothetical protein|nr:hypothetical protein [Chthoniobacteraceae bacterium]
MSAHKKVIPKVSHPAYPGEQSFLAMRILIHPNIKLAKTHPSKKKDSANSSANILESMFMLKANRSSYGKGSTTPGGSVPLSLDMLRGMLELAKTYSFHVSEIAGGEHSKHSRHYAGIAFDVDTINGKPVSAHHKQVLAFEKKCRALGATEVLGPGYPGHSGHVHCGWPRPH